MNSNQHKVIGFWRGWSIAVGCSVGSGIFMMPAMLAPYGMLGFFGWLIAGRINLGCINNGSAGNKNAKDWRSLCLCQ